MPDSRQAKVGEQATISIDRIINSSCPTTEYCTCSYVHSHLVCPTTYKTWPGEVDCMPRSVHTKEINKNSPKKNKGRDKSDLSRSGKLTTSLTAEGLSTIMNVEIENINVLILTTLVYCFRQHKHKINFGRPLNCSSVQQRSYANFGRFKL